MKNYLLIGLMILSLPMSTKAIEAENPINENHLTQLMWGKNRTNIPGLKCIDNQSNDQAGLFKVYICPNDPQEVAGIKIKQIRYIFWRDQLCGVTILTEGYENYSALKQKAAVPINRPDREKTINSQSVWFGSKTIASTTYDKTLKKGRLQLKSTDINRKIQLIKCTPTNVYSSWIKSRRKISRH